MKSYDPASIEAKWQNTWEQERTSQTPDSASGKENFYALVEFPYPSGNLHTGHWYAFAVPDIFVRYMRMRGYNVLFPIGFDAFGLPAENAAIKHGINPRAWTEQNIAYMRKQLCAMGASFDWSREVATCDPEYYRWTQWLFLQLFSKGLAYQDETPVNWCDSCRTVLANEQVVAGVCERCGTQVHEKHMRQWMLRITNYAEKLLDGLEELDWPEEIKTAQRNWVGKSVGARITFMIQNAPHDVAAPKPQDAGSRAQQQLPVDVFTTRPDTLFGATFLVMGPEHSLLSSEQLTVTNRDQVDAYIAASRKKTAQDRFAQKEKTGVRLEGVCAINPATQTEIPVFVADYVLGDVGTGAIMAVPAHDERDFAFAKAHDLSIREVIEGGDIASAAYTGEGILLNSGKFNGMSSQEAREAITTHVGGKNTVQYRLRDWVVSRQRYWGCPIPVIHCAACGAVAVSYDQLPVELPEIEDYMPDGNGKSPLAKVSSWVHTTCPQCGGAAERETDTLDTFVDSSWYFLRYIDPHNSEAFADVEKLIQWMPVDFYSGGAEHTTMHLLYSRFFQHTLYDCGLVRDKEPYVRRMNRGLILGPDNHKMSKSRGNVVEPDEYVQTLGADTVRMYLAFIGPYDEAGSYPWNPDSIIGVRKFLDRVWRYFNGRREYIEKHGIGEMPHIYRAQEIERILHQSIKKVSESIEAHKFNTAVSQLMILFRGIEQTTAETSSDGKQYLQDQYARTILTLLAPFAPYLAEELWQKSSFDGSVHSQPWPQYNEKKAEADEVIIVLQVNGRVRDKIVAAKGMTKTTLENLALENEKLQKYIGGASPKKIIVVPDRLVNIVV